MLIKLRKVDVELGGRPVLSGVDLTLEPGRVTAVTGPSGSGTSVLLKAAAGLIEPGAGSVLYDGRDYAALGETEKLRLQTRTGFMFQDAALWANMSVAANLDLPLQAKHPGLGAAARRQMVTEALAGFGFTIDPSLRPAELSLGERKFVSFLRAVIPAPEAVFLDEPLAGLDGRWAEIVIGRLDAMRAAGAAVVLGSHKAELPTAMIDRLVCLDQGRIVDRVGEEAEGTRR